MKMVDMEDCSTQQIHDLKYHPHGEDAMVAFCKLNLGGPVRWKGEAAHRDKELYSFYIFTAPTTLKGELYAGQSYAQNFAKFIEKHGFGTVWESPAQRNMIFHTDHANKVWIWMPNNKALREWWAARGSK